MYNNKSILARPNNITLRSYNCVVSFFDEKRFNYVAKADNPPNVPECRAVLKKISKQLFIKTKTFQVTVEKITKNHFMK